LTLGCDGLCGYRAAVLSLIPSSHRRYFGRRFARARTRTLSFYATGAMLVMMCVAAVLLDGGEAAMSWISDAFTTIPRR